MAVPFLLIITASLVFAPAPEAVWRALAGLCTACLLWHPVKAVIFQSGPSAIRRVSWASDGHWLIGFADGTCHHLVLHSSSAALGPWLILAWRVSAARFGGRFFALIHAADVSPATFRALRGRLRLDQAGVRERHGRPRGRVN